MPGRTADGLTAGLPHLLSASRVLYVPRGGRHAHTMQAPEASNLLGAPAGLRESGKALHGSHIAFVGDDQLVSGLNPFYLANLAVRKDASS